MNSQITPVSGADLAQIRQAAREQNVQDPFVSAFALQTENAPVPAPLPPQPIPFQPPVAQSLPVAPQFDGGLSYRPQVLQGLNKIVHLPDGHHLEMGPPPTATQMLQYKIIGNDYNPGKALLVRALFYVRSIDGRPVRLPDDSIGLQELMNVIGDIGVEHAIAGLIQHWPPVTSESLPEIKKNL